MKNKYPRFLSVLCALMIATGASWAVPAYRGWQTRTQPDGTTITIRQVGDEFYHYWETEDGKVAVEQPDGTFVVTDADLPTAEQVQARRQASKRYVKRALMVGAATKPARALFILVSFSNLSFKDASATYYKSKLGDATEGAMSMYNYLKQQSNGAYAPPVDVFGPVTLSSTYATYGANDSNGDDTNPAQMIADACSALDSQIDFSQYDSNSDGVVDNVYVLYAGKGEADGGAANTIWPHQWTLQAASITLRLDGKYIRSYACSAELNGSGKCAMGTPLHEFGHVIGLPDYYDTEYKSTNYTESRTPGAWSIMDQGSYNNDGNTPPNYSIFDKYYLGWLTPKFLAKDATDNVTLTTAYGDGYQITGGTSRVAYSNTNTVYYIENRQKSGWDAYLPGHGMVVWQVKYNSTNWNNNDLNNTGGSPRYTVLSASGNPKNIGRATDPFPGTGNVKTWTPFTGCALTDITESAGNITFKYNGGIDCHAVVTSGTGCTITPSTTCVENGNSFTATITPTDETYDYTSLTVKRGSTTLTNSTHYTLSSDKKTLTVKATAVTGSASDAFTITAVWTKNRYKYELLGENCTEELSGAVAKNAALNITVTPDAGYTLADAGCWDVSMGGTTLTYGTGFTYNSSTNTFSIASVTGDVEIMAYGSPSVTWYANGSLLATNVAVSGALTLPDSPADCASGKVFVGWTENSSITNGTKPADLFTSGTGKTVTGNKTYYAVYATASAGGGASDDFELYSGALTEGDYVVYYSGKALKAAISSNRLSYGEVTPSDDVITTTDASLIWHIAASGDYWTIYNENASKYAAANGTKNQAALSDSGTDDKSLWSCSSTASSTTYDFVNKYNSSNSVNANLRNNGTYGFACYATGTGGALSLYKNVGGGASYSDYSLTCGVLCSNTPTMSFSPATVSKTTADASFTKAVTITGKGSGQTVAYSSSDETIATVNNSGVVTLKGKVGSTIITASVAANGTYCAAEASYTLNVTAAPINVTLYYNGTSATLNNQTPPYTLPTTGAYVAGMCDGDWTFAGWYGSAYDKSTTAPTYITELTTSGSAYAVYTTTETSSGAPVRKSAATAGTTLWAEDFSGLSAGDVPSSANTGTTVYGGASITYSVENGGGTTKVYNEANAGGAAPELLIAKSNGSLTVSGIPSGDATEMALTFASNKTTFAVTTTETTKLDITGSGTSWTISVKAGQTAPETFDLTIKNTSSSNSRVDDIILTVTTAGSSGPTSTAYYATTPDCSSTEPCELTGIELNTSGVTKSFATGATLDYTGLVVTASYSNCSSQTVLPTEVTVSPSMATAGSKTVTVSYTENATTKTATYTITVVAPKTVTYVVCGDVFTTQNYAPGTALVLPDAPGGYDGLTFAGWTTTEHYTGASAPAFISAGGAVNADVTYYAVFH